MFTDCAQVHAPAGPVKEDHHADGKDQRDQRGHIDIEVVQAAGEPAAEQLGDLISHRQRLCGAVKKEAAQKEGNAGTDQVHGNTAYRLIRFAGHGSKSVDQSEESSGEPCTDKTEPGTSGIISDRRAGKGSDRHHAFNTDIDDTGDFGDDTSLGREDHGRRIHECDSQKEQYSVSHFSPPFIFLRSFLLRLDESRRSTN